VNGEGAAVLNRRGRGGHRGGVRGASRFAFLGFVVACGGGATKSSSPGTTGGPATQDAPPPEVLVCTTDDECVAVDKNACCPNGTKEAVSAMAVDAYRASFRCPQARPLCPMDRVLDARVAECSNANHTCEMIKPEEIRCGGFVKNPHDCPPGYRCARETCTK
jgi:hypothetical protein